MIKEHITVLYEVKYDINKLDRVLNQFATVDGSHFFLIRQKPVKSKPKLEGATGIEPMTSRSAVGML